MSVPRFAGNYVPKRGASTVKVGIVGAGITGLTLSHYLHEREVDHVVFEATDRPGGVIRSERIDGVTVECGPQRLRLTDPLAEITDAVGITDDLVFAPDDLPLYIYADGTLRQVPTDASAFLTTDLLSWRGRARLCVEPLTGPIRDRETAAEAFIRKFGREAYRNVIEPLYGGIYGSDPAAMPAEHALTRLRRLEEREGSLLRPAIRRIFSSDDTAPAAVFKSGMERLPQALYEANSESIRLETPVRSLRWAGSGIGADHESEANDESEPDHTPRSRYVIETDGGEEEFDQVVVTADAASSAELLQNVVHRSEAFATLTYNPLVMIHVRADHSMDGFGFQVRRDEPLSLLGASWNGSTFGRENLHTCFFGGMHDPELVEAPNEQLTDLVCEEYESIIGVTPEVINVHRWERGFPAYDRSWAVTDEITLPNGLHLATNYTGGVGIPSRVREAKLLAEKLSQRT